MVVLKIVLVVHCSDEEPLPDSASAEDVADAGMTVVDTGKLDVWVRAGQSVTLAAQDVTV